MFNCLIPLLLGESDADNKVLQDSFLVSEEMVVVFLDHLSTAIQEEDIGELARFREYFDDAWLCVPSLSIIINAAKNHWRL